MKFSWAISWIKWLNGEKNIPKDHPCPHPQGADPKDKDRDGL
jgi:hypothetical protein